MKKVRRNVISSSSEDTKSTRAELSELRHFMLFRLSDLITQELGYPNKP